MTKPPIRREISPIVPAMYGRAEEAARDELRERAVRCTETLDRILEDRTRKQRATRFVARCLQRHALGAVYEAGGELAFVSQARTTRHVPGDPRCWHAYLPGGTSLAAAARRSPVCVAGRPLGRSFPPAASAHVGDRGAPGLLLPSTVDTSAWRSRIA